MKWKILINIVKKNILVKWSYLEKEFFSEQYSDYIKIFIIRNPLYVFTSLNKKFSNKLIPGHDIPSYINCVDNFINYRNNKSIKNLYLIKYEDMFKDNYKILRQIFNLIGFKYKDNIFENKNYTNIIHSKIQNVKDKPDEMNHGRYRQWQINQPIKNMNENINLTNEQINILKNNKNIIELYPNIKNLV